MADPDQDRGASRPPDDDPPSHSVEASSSRPESKVDFERTAQGRSDTPGSTDGVRVGPVAGAVAVVAALGTISGLLRRRRVKQAQASIRARRRSRIGGAGGTPALSAVLASLRARSARRGR